MNTSSKIRFFVMALSAIICSVNITSCIGIETPSGNETGENSGIPTKIIPTMDWGASQSEVMPKQNNELSLTVSTENLLRYTSESQDITIDYKFENDKLTGTSLTQAKISSVNDIANSWLKDYNQLAKSEMALLYASRDNSTLAYGKIMKGSECDYAAMAWTYIDANGETDDEPDFSPSGQENGYDFVDLGVGVGWAVQNVGASSPEKSGGYYMWGETVTRTKCWWWYYSLYMGDVNDYFDANKFYTPYSDISGTSYDAAKVKMGGNWRMPTRAEFYTLINNCEFNVGEYNGVSGFIVTGSSGKSLFFPAAGLKEEDEIEYTNTVYLWSSTSYEQESAYYLDYMLKNLDDSGMRTMWRSHGMPIRGVIDIK